MDDISIPTLRSSRLVLRALHADDHPHMLALANDSEVARHMHEGPPPSAGRHPGLPHTQGRAQARAQRGRSRP
mgnify:CR=1 FL=1